MFVLKMALSIKDIFVKELDMALESRFGQMVKNTKASGNLTNAMARAGSGILMAIIMKAIGRMANLKDLAYILRQMAQG